MKNRFKPPEKSDTKAHLAGGLQVPGMHKKVPGGEDCLKKLASSLESLLRKKKAQKKHHAAKGQADTGRKRNQ
jgi:hypothetical protein